MGEHPRPQRGQGSIWVDGTLNPQPTKWRIDNRISVEKMGSRAHSGETDAAANDDENWDCCNDGNQSEGEGTSATRDGTTGNEANSDSMVCRGEKQIGDIEHWNVSTDLPHTSAVGKAHEEKIGAKRARFSCRLHLNLFHALT